MRKLDMRVAESLNAEIGEQANKIRTLQEELRAVRDQMVRNRGEFRRGDIARDVYIENNKRMRENEGKLKHKIRHTISHKTSLLNRAVSMMHSNRVHAKKHAVKHARRKVHRARRRKR